MTYHAANHWKAFRAGAKTFCGRRTFLCSNRFRDRVIDVALSHWPTRQNLERYEFASHVYNDEAFRRELGLSPLAWWVLGLIVKAILDALVDYWFETQTWATGNYEEGQL